MVKDLRIRRLPLSFKYAARGAWHVLRTEQNVRIHAAAAIIVIILGAALEISAIEWAVVLLAIGLVIGSEILNTVIEDFLDILHPEHHPAVRRIKDALAGAVLLGAIISLVIGVLIFGPRILAALQ
jgi:undecaprenol kinase